ncbi:MAG: hypothetical protein LQ338_006877 [Usnochroma carphineum]|nr:MAG: hypothetical protein LQ338_006877 [Usnochroma carphineum]
MSDRARLSKLPSWVDRSPPGTQFLGSEDFPAGLVKAVELHDPAAMLLGKLDGPIRKADKIRSASVGQARLLPLMKQSLQDKRILNLSGGADKLVPYRRRSPRKQVDWTNAELESAIILHELVGDREGLAHLNVRFRHGRTLEALRSRLTKASSLKSPHYHLVDKWHSAKNFGGRIETLGKLLGRNVIQEGGSLWYEGELIALAVLHSGPSLTGSIRTRLEDEFKIPRLNLGIEAQIKRMQSPNCQSHSIWDDYHQNEPARHRSSPQNKLPEQRNKGYDEVKAHRAKLSHLKERLQKGKYQQGHEALYNQTTDVDESAAEHSRSLNVTPQNLIAITPLPAAAYVMVTDGSISESNTVDDHEDTINLNNDD